MVYRILIVEDDGVIAGTICRQIEAWGCEARQIRDFRNVLSEFVEFAPHLVLMDISLPFYDGYHWCSEIRRVSRTPVIFLSSASDNMNILMALNMGGDDFIAKPFDLNVLTAKVQAMLRRATGIGLYLCRRILTRLGHGIEIESALGQGTKVTLLLDSAKLEVE